MYRDADPWSPQGVVVGLLTAVAAAAFTLLLAVLGQALGALAGGCTWIGISTSPYRQVWALVNEPTLNFASLPRAFGYWWGSLLLPLAVAGFTVPLVPRRRTVAAELAAVHVAWMATVVGVAWLPLLDPREGHLARWLELVGRPADLLWLAPATAALLAVPVTLRLLALARAARRDLPRLSRVGLVLAHLVVPAVGWCMLVVPLRGTPPVTALAGLAMPVAVALVVAWTGYPTAYAFRLDELSGGTVVRALVAALVGWALVLGCGRPLSDGSTAGVLWAAPSARNNVRPWISPTHLYTQPEPVKPAGYTGAIAERGARTHGPRKGPSA